jgi:hypothetical protein
MFNQPSINDYYRRLQEQVRGEILGESEEQIIGTNTEELAKYYFEKYALSSIEEDNEAEANVDIQDYLQDVPEHRRENIYHGEGTLRNMPSQRAIVEVPILPNKDLDTLSQLQGSTVSMSYSYRDFTWGRTAIRTTIETKGYQFEMDAAQIGSEVNQALGRIRGEIHWKNEAVVQCNRELMVHIVNQIAGINKK